MGSYQDVCTGSYQKIAKEYKVVAHLPSCAVFSCPLVRTRLKPSSAMVSNAATGSRVMSKARWKVTAVEILPSYSLRFKLMA